MVIIAISLSRQKGKFVILGHLLIPVDDMISHISLPKHRLIDLLR
jgi:hypothetical protein